MLRSETVNTYLIDKETIIISILSLFRSGGKLKGERTGPFYKLLFHSQVIVSVILAQEETLGYPHCKNGEWSP